MANNNNTMKVDVVDSEEQIFSGIAEFLVAPASEGEIGVYPNHIPLISTLKPGVLRLQLPNESVQQVFAISGGFMEVHANHVTVLADVVERTDALDEARIIEQKNLAESKIKNVDSSNVHEAAKAHAALEIAIAQLKAVEYIKKHRV
jgi:F-type H+-transporting ATPase subunit epsilon